MNDCVFLDEFAVASGVVVVSHGNLTKEGSQVPVIKSVYELTIDKLSDKRSIKREAL